MSEEIKENNEADITVPQTMDKAQKKRERKKFWLGFLVGVVGVLLAACIVSVVAYLGFRKQVSYSEEAQLSTGKKSGSSSVVTSATTAKMTMIERLIKKNYYMDVDEEELRDGIYRGMLASLNDPYSEYYSAEDLKEVIESNEGIYYGIGAYVSLDTDLNLSVISGIISGTPAEEAGLQEGDIIYKVDGTDTTGMSVSEKLRLLSTLVVHFSSEYQPMNS